MIAAAPRSGDDGAASPAAVRRRGAVSCRTSGWTKRIAWRSKRGGPRRAWRGGRIRFARRPLRIGVIALPHMSNFTDFDALAAEPSVSLAYLDAPMSAGGRPAHSSRQQADARRSRVAPPLGFEPHLGAFRARRRVLGICGGLQMLGTGSTIRPAESGGRPCSREGLGLLRVITVLHTEKITRPVSGRTRAASFCGHACREVAFRGYEIHVGETVLCDGRRRSRRSRPPPRPAHRPMAR